MKGKPRNIYIGMALALIQAESLLRYFKTSPLLPETVTNALSQWCPGAERPLDTPSFHLTFFALR